MRIPVALLVLVPTLAAAPSSSLQFVGTPGSTAQGVVPMANGSVAVFGAVPNNGCVAGALALSAPGSCHQTEPPLFSILDVSGNQKEFLANTALGSGNSSITGAAVDASGNFWVAGETDSDDFPLVHPFYSQKAAYNQIGFVAKLDPNLNILFSSFIGGQPAFRPTSVASVALDSAGNAYVAGETYDPGFPATGPVFGVGAPGNAIGYTFLIKVSADGSRLIFSRLLGGNQASPCPFQAPCPVLSTASRAMAVDANGNVTIVGATNATNFPVTANAYVAGTGAFASRISADGSQLIWSTTMGGPGPAYLEYLNSDFANSVALDAAGDVYITGMTSYPIATTPGALQPEPPNGAQLPGLENGNGFVIKLSADATRLLFATNLATSPEPGGNADGRAPAGIAVDSVGNAWITGHTADSNFPGLSNVPSSGLDFALELNSNATAVQQVLTFLPPTATQPPAFDSNGNLILLASAGNLVRVNAATALTAPAVFAMTNSAIPQASASVGPGELLTLYGVGLGPATGMTGEPDQNGLYPTELGGVTVKVSGVAAPLLYAGPDQINLQMPFELESAAGGPSIVVTTPTGPLPALVPQVVFRSIGIFVVVNEDFSLNTPSNPAAAGSIVILYLTGLGGTGGEVNGAISQAADSAFMRSIEVTDGIGVPEGEILYAGTAPDLINGVDQVNVQLPPQNCPQNCPTKAGLQLVVQTVPALGSVTSNTVTVYTH